MYILPSCDHARCTRRETRVVVLGSHRQQGTVITIVREQEGGHASDAEHGVDVGEVDPRWAGGGRRVACEMLWRGFSEAWTQARGDARTEWVLDACRACGMHAERSGGVPAG